MSTSIPAPAPSRRSTSPIVVILLVLLGLFALGAIAIVGGGIFLAHKIAKDPARIARMVAAANPNAEIISSDDAKGTFTIRDKNSGKEVTVSLDDITRGHIRVFENGKEVRIRANADSVNGGVEITSSDGSHVQIGGGSGKMPLWVPVYPGTHAQGVYSSRDATEEKGTASFELKQPINTVADYYSDVLGKEGFKVTKTGSGGTVVVHGEDEANHRTVVFTVETTGGGVTVSAAFTRKNKE